MTPLAYALWLAHQPARAEVLRGLWSPTAGEIRLDAEAVAANGWRKFDGAVKLDTSKRLLAGGYAENRAVYGSELFSPKGEEPRTLHLGLDIFAPAGASVFAPTPGRVHSFQDNAGPGNYGPTLILEHDAGSGGLLHTLYGHLSRDSLAGLVKGRTFTAGERIGRLGAPPDNGDWPPHLHFQVLLEMGDAAGDYPGACRRSEQDRWLAICPDPRPLLGLPGEPF